MQIAGKFIGRGGEERNERVDNRAEEARKRKAGAKPPAKGAGKGAVKAGAKPPGKQKPGGKVK